MPDTRKHRGPGPQDPTWFGAEAHTGLRAAVADLSWLLSRGYAETSALSLVGNRYRLVERQRVAVLRSACSDDALAGRRSRELDPRSIRGRPLRIDAFNLILTLESALGGGVVLAGRDGCYRDMASVYGTYRRVEETRPALDLAAKWLGKWGVGPCTWLLDAPVSNSGRLAAMIRAVEPDWATEVIPDPDAELITPGAVVATADAGVLNRCGEWVSLARTLVEVGVKGAFVVDLRYGATAADLFTQLLILAVEKHDMADHEVAGVGSHERPQAPRLIETARDRFLQQDRLARLEERSHHRNVRRGRARHDPRFRFGVADGAFEIRPPHYTGNSLASASRLS